MNKRVSKLIRKFVARNYDDPVTRKRAVKKMKNTWKKTPWNRRHILREEME